MKPYRILGIDPVRWGCAFVVWDQEIGLVDFGISVRDAVAPHRAVLNRLIAKHRPDVLVLEDSSSTLRKARFRRIAKSLAASAVEHDVLVAFAKRPLSLRGGSVATKRAAALALASQYPELARRVPRVRKLWMNEDGRMNIFDALCIVENFRAQRK